MKKMKLDITVNSAPDTPKPDDVIAAEIEMIKAGILYGDTVTLNSVASSMLSWHNECFLNIQGMEPYDAIMLIKRIGDTMPPEIQVSKTIQTLLEKTERTNIPGLSQRDLINTLVRQIPNFPELMIEAHLKQQKDTGFDELLKLEKNGLIKIIRLDFEKENERIRDDFTTGSDPGLRNFFDYLFRVLDDGSSFPLLDPQLAGIIRSAILEKKITLGKSVSTRNKQIGLVAKVFQRLPLFDKANINQIQDIRTDLEPYLSRFRAAIVDFSESISSAQWNTDFEHDVTQVFIQKVQPAIEAIEDEVQSHSYLKILVSRYATKPMATIPVLSVGLGPMFNFDVLLAAIAGSAVTTANIAHTIFEYSKGKNEIRNNNLFFLYELNNHLIS